MVAAKAEPIVRDTRTMPKYEPLSRTSRSQCAVLSHGGNGEGPSRTLPDEIPFREGPVFMVRSRIRAPKIGGLHLARELRTKRKRSASKTQESHIRAPIAETEGSQIMKRGVLIAFWIVLGIGVALFWLIRVKTRAL